MIAKAVTLALPVVAKQPLLLQIVLYVLTESTLPVLHLHLAFRAEPGNIYPMIKLMQVSI